MDLGEECDKHTGLEFKSPAEDVHQELHDRVHGGQDIGKEDEADDDGKLLVEAKGLVEGTVVDEDGEEGEYVEHVEFRDAHQLCCVSQFPVSELVAQHRDDFLGVGFLDQCVVDYNVFLPRETIEICIAVGAALAAVNDIEFGEGEAKAFGQGFDAGLELAFFKRRELVEEGEDSDGVDGDCEDLNADAEEPEVVEEAVAGLLDDGEEPAEQGGTENDEKGLRLEEIGKEESRGLFVEAEFLLENEGAVPGYGEIKDRADEVEDEKEEECMGNFAAVC